MFRTIFSLLSLMILYVCSANAQIVVGGGQTSSDGCIRMWDGACYGTHMPRSDTYRPVTVGPSIGQRVVLAQQNNGFVFGNAAPYGVVTSGGQSPFAFSKCEFWGGLLGGAIGNEAHNHRTPAIIAGMIVGAVAGDALCEARNKQTGESAGKVLVREGQIMGYACKVDGLPETYITKSVQACADLASAVNNKKPVAQQQKTDPKKPWGHKGENGVCYLTQISGSRIPQECITSKEVPAEDGETMESWKNRLPK